MEGVSGFRWKKFRFIFYVKSSIFVVFKYGFEALALLNFFKIPASALGAFMVTLRVRICSERIRV
jgi:hypothetical protein